MGFEGSNTVVSNAFDATRLTQIHDDAHFGLDIDLALEVLKSEFEALNIDFDSAQWANETRALSARNLDINKARGIIGKALHICGVELVKKELVDRVLAGYGFQLEA